MSMASSSNAARAPGIREGVHSSREASKQEPSSPISERNTYAAEVDNEPF